LVRGLGVDKGLEVLSAEVLVKETKEEVELLLGLSSDFLSKGLQVVEAVMLDFIQEFLLVGFRPIRGGEVGEVKWLRHNLST